MHGNGIRRKNMHKTSTKAAIKKQLDETKKRIAHLERELDFRLQTIKLQESRCAEFSKILERIGMMKCQIEQDQNTHTYSLRLQYVANEMYMYPKDEFVEMILYQVKHEIQKKMYEMPMRNRIIPDENNA
jgi:DNA-directed RNA polymerase subunit L